ncbi:MAG: hypothetical protein VKJ06_05825 [Vampirovibrionales bacterium]|nr:hypothetical protein [Vampirovibrionales bacterium]
MRTTPQSNININQGLILYKEWLLQPLQVAPYTKNGVTVSWPGGGMRQPKLHLDGIPTRDVLRILKKHDLLPSRDKNNSQKLHSLIKEPLLKALMALDLPRQIELLGEEKAEKMKSCHVLNFFKILIPAEDALALPSTNIAKKNGIELFWQHHKASKFLKDCFTNKQVEPLACASEALLKSDN